MLVSRKVEELTPYGNNSRTHNEAQVAQLAASIKEFGFTNPVLIDEQNTIIAGEGRVLAAGKLQLETVPCIVLTGLTEGQKAAYVIADNKLALNSSWDTALLYAELGRISDMDLDMNLTGFSDVEVIALIDHLENELADALESTGITPPIDIKPGAQDDWSGMPDFHQPNDKPFRTVIVHLPNQAAVDAFTKLVNQRLTNKTKYLWYPQQAKIPATGAVYA